MNKKYNPLTIEILQDIIKEDSESPTYIGNGLYDLGDIIVNEKMFNQIKYEILKLNDGKGEGNSKL